MVIIYSIQKIQYVIIPYCLYSIYNNHLWCHESQMVIYSIQTIWNYIGQYIAYKQYGITNSYIFHRIWNHKWLYTEYKQYGMITYSIQTTVRCSYNAVQYIMIFYIVVYLLMQNINQNLYSQKTPHMSPSRASYGVSLIFCTNFGGNWPRYNGPALYMSSQMVIYSLQMVWTPVY